MITIADWKHMLQQLLRQLDGTQADEIDCGQDFARVDVDAEAPRRGEDVSALYP